MANWLIQHFIWVAIVLIFVLLGIKIVFGAVLKRLMDASAEAEAVRDRSPSDPRDQGRN